MRLVPLAPDTLVPEMRAVGDDTASEIAQHLKGFVSKHDDGALIRRPRRRAGVTDPQDDG